MRLFAPRLQSTPELSRTLLISPLLEQPGFSLASIHPIDAEEVFHELRVDGVLRSSAHELRATCCAATLRRAGCPRRRVGRSLPITGTALPCPAGEPSGFDSSRTWV